MTNITKVGIGLAILKGSGSNTQVLLGKRKGSHGEGEWGLPGGHMEYLESFKAVAERETEEEIGDKVKFTEPVVVSVINLTEYAPKHYIDIGMVADWVEGDPEIMEPLKCEAWEWFDVDNLPSPLFATVERIVEAATAYETRQFDTAFVWDKE